MSGAALWIGERLVGIISKNHPGDGIAKLAAARIDRALERAVSQGIHSPDFFLAVPSDIPIPDVVPAPASELYLTAYRAQVSSIAPVQLLDREGELDSLTRFCASETEGNYAWWRADPWAGKTALLSTFVLHPPAGLDVISFFITSRYAGQADSNAFLEAMQEQLMALVGEQPSAVSAAPHVRVGNFLRLLDDAAKRSAELGRRLVIIIDGLDEDRSRSVPFPLPSIASLLPIKLTHNTRIIIAGRHSPNLPSDVPDDHPLRRLAHRPLTSSPHAQIRASAAIGELEKHLSGSPPRQEILGLITAAGGGLSAADLAELIDRDSLEITRLLQGPLGQTISERPAATTLEGRMAEVFLFAHETLREYAVHQFGRDIAIYRDRLHSWAEKYRAERWPQDTPQYLFRGYFRMLAAANDVPRMMTLACDRVRHNVMLSLTGGDSLGLNETTAAVAAIRSPNSFDVCEDLLIEIAHEELAERNSKIPPPLPQVWALVGQPDRATALANGIVDPERRAAALRLVIEARPVVERELTAELCAAAEVAASSIRDPAKRLQAIYGLVIALGKQGSLAEVERLLEQINDQIVRLQAISDVAFALTDDRQNDRIRVMLERELQQVILINTPQRDHALGWLVAAMIANNDLATADTLSRQIGNHDAAAIAISRIAASGSIARAHTVASHVLDASLRARLLAEVAAAAAAAGRPYVHILEEARTAANSILHARSRAIVNTYLGELVASEDELEEAERRLLRARSAYRGADAELSRLAKRAAVNGFHERAEHLANSISDAGAQKAILSALAEEAARQGAITRKQFIIENSSNPLQCARLLSTLLRFAAKDLNPAVESALADSTVRIAHSLPNSEDRASALSELGAALAARGATGEAVSLAEMAEDVALHVTSRKMRDHALESVAVALAMGNKYVEAASLAATISDLSERRSVLENLAYRTLQLEQYDDSAYVAGFLDPGHQLFKELALLYGRRGAFRKAADAARQLTAVEASKVLKIIGLLAEERDDCQAACDIYRLIPDSVEAIAQVGRLCLQQGSAKKRDRMLTELMSIAVRSNLQEARDLAYTLEARVAAEKGKFASAIPPVEKIEDAELRDQVLFRLICSGAHSQQQAGIINVAAMKIGSSALRCEALVAAADVAADMGVKRAHLSTASACLNEVPERDRAALVKKIEVIERQLDVLREAGRTVASKSAREGPESAVWHSTDTRLQRIDTSEADSEFAGLKSRIASGSALESAAVRSREQLLLPVTWVELQEAAKFLRLVPSPIDRMEKLLGHLRAIEQADLLKIVESSPREDRDSSLATLAREFLELGRGDCLVAVALLMEDVVQRSEFLLEALHSPRITLNSRAVEEIIETMKTIIREIPTISRGATDRDPDELNAMFGLALLAFLARGAIRDVERARYQELAVDTLLKCSRHSILTALAVRHIDKLKVVADRLKNTASTDRVPRDECVSTGLGSSTRVRR
jgi:hypothetical protein